MINHTQYYHKIMSNKVYHKGILSNDIFNSKKSEFERSLSGSDSAAVATLEPTLRRSIVLKSLLTDSIFDYYAA